MKKKLFVFAILVVFIGLCNTGIGSWIMGMLTYTDTFMGDARKYKFVSGNSGFKHSLSGGFKYKDIKMSFEDYKKTNPNDTILYRTFHKNPIFFWKWRVYLFEEMYQLPYKDHPTTRN